MRAALLILFLLGLIELPASGENKAPSVAAGPNNSMTILTSAKHLMLRTEKDGKVVGLKILWTQNQKEGDLLRERLSKAHVPGGNGLSIVAISDVIHDGKKIANRCKSFKLDNEGVISIPDPPYKVNLKDIETKLKQNANGAAK